jgi:tetratricopeptide (TPR) repeat protein/predicted Ser/Thr protein kinase
MIGKTISHYKILEKLGEGGMGVVYKAQDTKLDRPVALKFLPPHLTSESEEKERFIHEAKAASALNHPNITTIHEIDEFEGQMFIVMEYCEGKTLKQIIEKETLPIKKVLDIGIQICEGLTAAHKKEIVHRDIKSDNIMVTKEGQVKIMDFGLAKLKGATKLTKTRSTLGTLAYMSPEQAQGEEVDSRSDIFSFGVVLYELLTKNLPFGGEHQSAIVYSIINEEPQPVARFNNQVSTKLGDIVFKALAKDKEERYQHIDDLLADLRHEKKNLDYLKTGQIPKEVIALKPKRKVLPIVIPASVVFILVLLFLILRPFKFEIGPEKGAVAKENSLAIMYFENMADPEDKDRIAQMITALLITGLSETPQYMQVVSSQRLYDILKLLGKENLKVIDKTVASEVAKKAGVKWILTGRLLQIKPNIVLISELSEATSGKILATQRVSGAIGEDLFAVVDKLSPQIAKALSLPDQAKKDLEKPVAQVTTHSQEAYRYYLEGLDYNNKNYFFESMNSLSKALEIDSTFAMAYYWLAYMRYMSNDIKVAKELITKATKYTDKITQKEKLYIKSMEVYISGNYPQAIKELQKIVEQYPEEKDAFFQLGEIYYGNLKKLDETILYLNKAIEIDPLYKVAYNTLAYAYNEIGDFDKSIWAINKYIELAPDEPNPYDSRAELYAWNGRLDQAIESYKKALEKKPDFYSSQAGLGNMYIFRKDYAKAESYFEALSSSSEKLLRSGGRLLLAFIPLYQGRFDDALKVLDDGIAADRMEQFEGSPNAYKHFIKASIFEEKKKWSLALTETQTGIQILEKVTPEDPVNQRDYYAYLLAETGKIAEAEEVARVLKKDIEQKNPTLMYSYWWTLGDIEQAKGNLKIATDHYEKADKDAPTPSFYRRYTLAKIYLETGRLDQAVAELEKALSRYDQHRLGIEAVKAYYLLGLAYEKSGWNNKAIAQYEEFLDIWKNADPGIPEIADAKERLNKLKVKS